MLTVILWSLIALLTPISVSSFCLNHRNFLARHVRGGGGGEDCEGRETRDLTVAAILSRQQCPYVVQ